MPTLGTIWLPTPRNEADLEELALDFFLQVWRGAQFNGRRGQRQHGVDIFGQRPEDGAWVGAQVKARRADKVLTAAEVLADVALAKQFRPQIKQLISSRLPHKTHIRRS